MKANRTWMAIWALSALVVILFAALAAGIHRSSHTAHEAAVAAEQANRAAKQANAAAKQANRALCLDRHVFTHNIQATRKFLVQHPHGIPSLGLTRSVLERGIANQTKQANALRDVPCSS